MDHSNKNSNKNTSHQGSGKDNAKGKGKTSIDKDKNEKDSPFKDISEVEYFNYGELDHYTKKCPNPRKKKSKKG